MIGTKLYKNNAEDMVKYTATAIWCNSNNAHIEDKGSYYEVCENVVPELTTEEKLTELDSRYNNDKNELMIAYLNAVVYGNTDLISDIKTEIEALDEAYDHDYEEIAGGGE